MSIDMRFEFRDDYLFVQCEGSYEFESMRRVYATSFAAAVRGDCRAVLVDVRDLTGEPPTIFERYTLGVYVAELQRGPARGVMIAGVGKRPMVHANKFGELVARNRSAVARIFTDMDEAIEWIKATLARTAAHEDQSSITSPEMP